MKARFAIVVLIMVTTSGLGAKAAEITVDAYGSIQEAVDANPGKMIRVPAGEHRVAAAITITTDGTGLYGQGTIIQTNPDAGIIDIRKARGVRLEGLTLVRAEGKMVTQRDAVRVADGEDFRLANLRIVDNRSSSAAIRIGNSRHGRIEGCEIVNYQRIGMDDRTTSELYGYAFRALLGDGIIVKTSTAMAIRDNRIVERNFYATEETKSKYELGQLTQGRRPTKKGKLAPPGDYVPHWHQGSAIVVTSPEITNHVLISGNLIENAAQGIDIHADHVTISNNVIDHAFVGIKCMHGSRNVIIIGNNVSHNDLWGLVMQPGTASHMGGPDSGGGTKRPNVTRGNVIANNIFSDFGYGYEYHNWKGSDSRNVLQFESGPLPTNPPMADVLVQGNIVYDPGREQEAAGDGATEAEPRYNHAVYVDPKLDAKTFRFAGNIFHPGKRGAANIELAR